MKVGYSLKDIREYIKHNGEPEIIEAVDKFLGLAIIFVPTLIDPSFGLGAASISAISDVLGIKNELAGVGKRILGEIIKKQDNGANKYRQMGVAYCLIAYSAFFEAIELVLPKIAKASKLNDKDKLYISEKALLSIEDRISKFSDGTLNELKLSEYEINLPHPAYGLNYSKDNLNLLYEEMTKEYILFIEGLAIWDTLSETQQNSIFVEVKKLPLITLEQFEVQCFSLANEFNEFYIWLNLFENSKFKRISSEISLSIRKFLDIANQEKASTDIGFKNLCNLIENAPIQYDAAKAIRILDLLKGKYADALKELVIKENINEGADVEKLIFPKKVDIFIPQAYKVLQYNNKDRLEDETIWDATTVRNDLSTFLVNYFSSAYSINSPLIILGHPGSGKSLLAGIIADRFNSINDRTILVKLRSVNASSSIARQIEEQIAEETGYTTSWPDIADNIDRSSSIVILDGYDELLQASGKVYSDYLNQAKIFQNNEIACKRKPVKIVITSRITLIDKANIPNGATVIRLMEFDNTKIENWVQVWNEANRNFFIYNKIKPFKLPYNNSKVMDLARQPLLLLMLAIFDSANNSLWEQENINQTILYDKLIRRFMYRERNKKDDFRNTTSENQEKDIENRIEALGIAAIAMFNRRTLLIICEQLNDDFKYLKKGKLIPEEPGRNLTQAELIMGSFFFVYKSQSNNKNIADMEMRQNIAYEFLHNTFGEFLTADYIIKKVFTNIKTIRFLREAKAKDIEINSMKENISDSLNCLMYTPLFSRPKILEMAKEWLLEYVKIKKIALDDFFEDFDEIIYSHTRTLLEENISYDRLKISAESSYPKFAPIGHLAVYTANLIILRTVLSPGGFKFRDEIINPVINNVKIWTQLLNLWKSWFDNDSLFIFSSIVETYKKKNYICLSARNNYEPPSGEDMFKVVISIAQLFIDETTYGMAGMILYDVYREKSSENLLSLKMIRRYLNFNNADLKLELLLKRIRLIKIRGCSRKNAVRITKIIFENIDKEKNIPSVNTENLIQLFVECFDLVYSGGGVDLLQEFADWLSGFCYKTYKFSNSVEAYFVLLDEVIDILQSYKIITTDILYTIYKRILEVDRRYLFEIPIGLKINIAYSLNKPGIVKFCKDYEMFNTDKISIRELPASKIVKYISIACRVNNKSAIRHTFDNYISNMSIREISTEIFIEILKASEQFKEFNYIEYLLNNYSFELRGRQFEGCSYEDFKELLSIAFKYNKRQFLSSLFDELFFIKNRDAYRKVVALESKLIKECINVATALNMVDFLNRYIKQCIDSPTIIYTDNEVTAAILRAIDILKLEHFIEFYLNNFIKRVKPEKLSEETLVELFNLASKCDIKSRLRHYFEYFTNFAEDKPGYSLEFLLALFQLEKIYGGDLVSKKIYEHFILTDSINISTLRMKDSKSLISIAKRYGNSEFIRRIEEAIFNDKIPYI